MIDRGKRSVLGVNVDAVDYDAAVLRITDAAKQRRPLALTALAVHGVMTGVQDPRHRFRLNQFDLVCPDGQPVRWALNQIHHCGLPDRVYGPELTLRLAESAAKEGLPLYLFGATEEMLERFAENLRQRFPELQIAGCRASRFRQLSLAERDELATEINASGAALCLVGLGCPRQEVFVYEMRQHISMPLVAVGAAFAFHAGVLEQAPPWMQRRGLEWVFRLSREPRRLWKRYLTTNPTFASLAILQKLGLYSAGTRPESAPTDEMLFG